MEPGSSSGWQGLGEIVLFVLFFFVHAAIVLNPWQYVKREDQFWIVRWALLATGTVVILMLFAYLEIFPIGLLSILYLAVYVLVFFIFWGWGDKLERQQRAISGIGLFVTACLVRACS